MPTAKTLNVTVEMINNFNALMDVAVPIFLKSEEIQDGDKQTETVREFKKLMLADYIPQIDIDHFEELVAMARDKANVSKMESTGKGENILDEGLENNDEMGGI